MRAKELTDLACKWLRARFPDAHIRRELSLAEYGGALIDVAAICQDQIVGVEVKGDGDSPSRLKLQGAMYGRICRKVYLLPSPSLLERCEKHKPPEWSIIHAPGSEVDVRFHSRSMICDASGIGWAPAIRMNPNNPKLARGQGLGLAPHALAAMIWTTEYSNFQAAVGEKEFTGLPRRKQDFINFVGPRYPLERLERAVCEIIRQRSWMDDRTEKPLEDAA